MEKTSYESGAPSWVDLASADPAGAAEFYSKLFGWEVADLGPEAGGYRMASLQGKVVAGIGPQVNPAAPAAWATYFASADIEATAARVLAHGGAVLAGPMDVMDAGRMAVFTDPGGAAFSAWHAGRHTGAELVNQAGAMCWHELRATDAVGPEAFYRAVFGWEVTGEDMGGSTYHVWTLGGEAVGGMMVAEDAATGGPPTWSVYFAVDDTDDTVARATALGGKVVMAPQDIPAGRFAILEDPVGATFGVIKGASDAGSGSADG